MLIQSSMFVFPVLVIFSLILVGLLIVHWKRWGWKISAAAMILTIVSLSVSVLSGCGDIIHALQKRARVRLAFPQAPQVTSARTKVPCVPRDQVGTKTKDAKRWLDIGFGIRHANANVLRG